MGALATGGYALVADQGATFTITSEMQSALQSVMTELAEIGSPPLAEDLERFRLNLDLDHLAGRTAAQLQEAIARGDTPVERIGWGRLKWDYR